MDTVVFAAVPKFETMVHNNSAPSCAATNWRRYLTLKAKSEVFFMTLVPALEEAELLCTVISGTGTDIIIPPQVSVPRIFPGA